MNGGMVQTVGALKARLQAVRDLHILRVEANGDGSGMRRVCRECRTSWPCATREAVGDDDD